MAKRLVSNLKDDYLCCRICLDEYRIPKTLPCDHIFCQQCLKRHISQSLATKRDAVHITCPLCRQHIPAHAGTSVDIDAWVESLPTDALVESLLQTVRVHEGQTSTKAASPLLCNTHDRKPLEAYCLTHAQLVCWECAARNHRACTVDSVAKADEAIQREIVATRKTVANQLAKARDVGKIDQQFKESKEKTWTELESIDRTLDMMYHSAKRQVDLLRDEIEVCSNLHLTEWTPFYDVVTRLLEHHYKLDTLSNDSQTTATTLGILESIKHDLQEATNSLEEIESQQKSKRHFVKFVIDEHVENFLCMYSSIGFIDSNVPGAAGSDHQLPTPRDAPLTISHILKRPGKPNVINTTKSNSNTAKPTPAVKTPTTSTRHPNKPPGAVKPVIKKPAPGAPKKKPSPASTAPALALV